MDPLTFALIAGGQSVMNQIGNWNQYNQQKEKLSKGRKLIQDFETGALSNLDQASENLFSTSANAIALNSNRNPVMLGKLASDVFAQTQNQKNQIRQNTQSQMMNLLNNEPVAPSIGGGIAEAVGAGMQGYIAGEQLNMSKDYMDFLTGGVKNAAEVTKASDVTSLYNDAINEPSLNGMTESPISGTSAGGTVPNLNAKFNFDTFMAEKGIKGLDPLGPMRDDYDLTQALAQGRTPDEMNRYNVNQVKGAIDRLSPNLPKMLMTMDPQSGFESPSDNDMFWEAYGNKNLTFVRDINNPYQAIGSNVLGQGYNPDVKAYNFDDPNNPANYMPKEELAKKMFNLFGAGDNNTSYWEQNENTFPKTTAYDLGKGTGYNERFWDENKNKYPRVQVRDIMGKGKSRGGKSINPFMQLTDWGY